MYLRQQPLYFLAMEQDNAMSPGIESLTKKFTALLLSISKKINSKIDRTEGAPTANKLTKPFKLALGNDATGSVSIQGDKDVTLELSLGNSGVEAKRYGTATSIPQITIDAKGRIIKAVEITVSPPSTILINEYITLASDAVKQYDLQAILGVTFVKYDIKATDVQIKAKDKNGNSPMYNSYANTEAWASYGIKDERYIIIANQSDVTLDLYVKISVNSKV